MPCNNCSHEKKYHREKECEAIDEYGCICECNYYFVTEDSQILEELE